MIIDVTKTPYYIKPDGKTDNTVSLMKLRTALAGKGKAHWTLQFPPGEIRYSDNRWLFGVYSFEIIGSGTVFRSFYSGGDDAFQRPFFAGELLQNNTLAYTGSKTYVTTDKFTSVNAGSLTITLSTHVNQYIVGNRVLLYAGSYADTGYPPPASAEWHEISAISGNVLTLKRPLERNYSTAVWDNVVISGGGSGVPRILNLDRKENIYCKFARFENIVFGNATGGGAGNVIFPAERLEMSRCSGEGFFWPSENRTALFEDMDVNEVEFDKLVNLVICNRVTFKGSPNGGGSIDKIILNDCQAGNSMRFDPRYLEIRNSHITANNSPDVFVAALTDYPARNPIRRATLESLTFSSGALSESDSHINLAPFNALTIATVSGKNIVTSDFDSVKTMEPGTTVLFNQDGSDGGLVTSITHNGTDFIIAGNWNAAPTVGHVWKWSYVKEVIDLGGHRALDDKQLWGGESIRWKGNSSAGHIKEMHLNQDDFKWVFGGNGNRTLDIYGHILSIEAYVTKTYGAASASISIENVDPYESLLTVNTKSLTPVSLLNQFKWSKQLTINTFSVSGAITKDVLPKFDIIVKWKPF